MPCGVSRGTEGRRMTLDVRDLRYRTEAATIKSARDHGKSRITVTTL
jgi:hypothetical protein